MNDEDKDPRRVGRDEMNLCEYPIASLTDHPPEGIKTLVFEDRQGRLTVIGSDAYGLPTALDNDVIVGLIQLTKLRNDFTNPAVTFSRYELLNLLGWPDRGQYYRRLNDSLHRWVTVTLKYDGCWWDNKRKRRVSASFHILEEVVLPDEDDPKVASSFTWGKKFFKSCRDGNLKRLNLDTYFGLKSAVAKQLYRFLDKRFYLRGDWTFDLPELAHEHVGLSRNYAPWKIKQKLQPALDELETIGLLEPMSAGDRYTKTGRGAWNIRLVRRLPAPAEARPAETRPPEPEPTGLEKELVDRGVTRSVAAELVRDFPEDRIRRQVEVVDWLREAKPKRIKDLGAYLAEAIRKDFAPPAGFRSRAERAAAAATARAQQDQREQARRATARAQAEQDRVWAYWEALPPERRAALDAEALDQAAPADRVEYAAAVPSVRRMLRTAFRAALIRRRLGLPAGSTPGPTEATEGKGETNGGGGRGRPLPPRPPTPILK